MTRLASQSWVCDYSVKVSLEMTDSVQGSPVGRWAGYFLLQHKNKLGGNRFFSKVRVFLPPGASMPYLVFYVDPTPAEHAVVKDAVAHAPRVVETELTVAKRVDSKGSTQTINKSDDGRNVLREHFVWKLS